MGLVGIERSDTNLAYTANEHYFDRFPFLFHIGQAFDNEFSGTDLHQYILGINASQMRFSFCVAVSI